MKMNRELFAGLAASPPLPAHPDNSLAGGSETQNQQLLTVDGATEVHGGLWHDKERRTHD